MFVSKSASGKSAPAWNSSRAAGNTPAKRPGRRYPFNRSNKSPGRVDFSQPDLSQLIESFLDLGSDSHDSVVSVTEVIVPSCLPLYSANMTATPTISIMVSAKPQKETRTWQLQPPKPSVSSPSKSPKREFEKLGIDYCCGGSRTLGEACAEAKISVDEALYRLQKSMTAAAPSAGQDWQESAACRPD